MHFVHDHTHIYSIFFSGSLLETLHGIPQVLPNSGLSPEGIQRCPDTWLVTFAPGHVNYDTAKYLNLTHCGCWDITLRTHINNSPIHTQSANTRYIVSISWFIWYACLAGDKILFFFSLNFVCFVHLALLQSVVHNYIETFLYVQVCACLWMYLVICAT